MSDVGWRAALKRQYLGPKHLFSAVNAATDWGFLRLGIGARGPFSANLIALDSWKFEPECNSAMFRNTGLVYSRRVFQGLFTTFQIKGKVNTSRQHKEKCKKNCIFHLFIFKRCSSRTGNTALCQLTEQTLARWFPVPITDWKWSVQEPVGCLEIEEFHPVACIPFKSHQYKRLSPCLVFLRCTERYVGTFWKQTSINYDCYLSALCSHLNACQKKQWSWKSQPNSNSISMVL